MPLSKRTGRYNPDTSTSYVVRTNLRRLRLMRGLTQDQAVSRLEPPHLSASSLGKIENGDRSVSIEEAVQLSVAYQVPIQVIVCPWEPLADHQRPALSGADWTIKEADAQNWLLRSKYPNYPGMIARVGSALEGAANSAVFSNPSNLKMLAESPTPETLHSLLDNAVKEIVSPLRQAIDNLIHDMEQWLGFDAFKYFEEFKENPKDYWPLELEHKLQSIELPNAEEKLEALWHAHKEILNIAHQFERGLLTDVNFATSVCPKDFDTLIQEQLGRIEYWRPIYAALRHTAL